MHRRAHRGAWHARGLCRAGCTRARVQHASHPRFRAHRPAAVAHFSGVLGGGRTRGEATGRGRAMLVWEEALPGRSAPARRASACKAPSGSAPAMPAVPGLRSSPRASSLGGSARLTAWRLFIRRQRQRELLADAGAFVLQGFCSLPPGLPPISPAPGPFFRLHAPMHHPNPGRCWSGGRGPQPRCPPCRTCHKATGMPDGCHAPPHSQQPPLGITRRTAEGLEVAPQRWLWAGGGWAPDPGLCCSALCQPG